MTGSVDNFPPRIPPLQQDEFGEEALEIANALRRTYSLPQEAAVPDAIATMLRHPGLYRAQIEFITTRVPLQELPPRDLELVILRTAWLCRSDYIWGEHVKAGKNAGLTTREIEQIVEGSSSPCWNDHDRAIVQAAEDLHNNSIVSDQTWAQLREDLNDKQLIELLHIVGFYHEIAFMYNSLRVRLIAGNTGLAAR